MKHLEEGKNGIDEKEGGEPEMREGKVEERDIERERRKD
jgi:hypothetical protein